MIGFFQAFLSGILIGLAYGIVAIAFSVIYQSSRIFNIAQGMIVVVSAYLVAWLATQMSLPLWLALMLAVIISVLLGLAIERGIFRRLAGEPVFSLVMATVGLYILLIGLVILIWGPGWIIFPSVFSDTPLKLGSLTFPVSLVWGGLICVILVAGLIILFERTTWGLKMSAVGESHKIAQSMGISVQQATAIAWVIGGFISTIAAIILFSGRPISTSVGEIGLIALPIALLAGLESVKGIIPAGIIVGVVSSLGAYYLDQYTGGGVAAILPFIVMIIIIAVRPTGLFGWKSIERV